MTSLLERHRAFLPKWLTLYYEEPIALVRGEGRTVWDSSGREYLDFFGGILTTMTGHAVPEVVEAVRDQAGRLLHSSTLYLIESQVELAEEIAALSGIPDAKVFFTNSGTEANDTALMLATAYRGSNQVLALRGSYHGRSISSLGVTGNRAWSPSPLSPFQVAFVHAGGELRSPFRSVDAQQTIAACTDDLVHVLQVATSGNVACMIAEPIQGVGGFVVPPDGLLGSFQRVLAEHGILLIVDEVQTGWGRTGEHFWGYQAHDVVPDILTFAKGLGNGLALGGVVARAEIMDCLHGASISTFGGNPIATRAALANLRYHQNQRLQDNAAQRGAQLLQLLQEGLSEVGSVAEVRGKGLMLGVELVQPGSSEPDSAAAKKVLEATRSAGLLIGYGGLFGNVLRIAPPLSVTSEEVEQAARILVDAVRAVGGRTAPSVEVAAAAARAR